MSCQEYFKRVKNIVDVIKSLVGLLCDDMHLKDELPEREPRGRYTEEQKREAQDRIHNKTMTCGILVRSDRTRFRRLIEEIENDYLKGHDSYPKMATEAYNLLVNYKNNGNQQNKRSAATCLDQVAFMTEAKRMKSDGILAKYLHIKCFKCGEFGHYKSDCPGKNKNSDESPPTETALTMLQVTLVVMRKEIDPLWILCDNESTIDIFKNKDILVNLRKMNKPIHRGCKIVL